jgi:predicted nucleic acid-binding protein
LIIPVGIISEICYLIELRLGHQVFALFFDDLIKENFSLDCGTKDLTDIKRLAERYDNLPLGYSDAAVVCCAVRTTQRIVSLDRRDFQVVQRELGLALLP